MSKQLPERPNLEHLRSQAKDLLKAFRQGDACAAQRFAALSAYREAPLLSLHDAQSVVAREYGFGSWPKLVAHVEQVRAAEGITEEIANRFVDLALSGGNAARLLELYPGLDRYSFAAALLSGNVGTFETIVGGVVPSPIPQSGSSLREGVGGGRFFAHELLPPKNWTALEYVCYSRFPNPDGLTACAKLLLENGADPNAFHTDPRWPDAPLPCLYGAACEAKNLELAKLLLEHGANPNDGESVYHSAQQGLIPMLELLKKYGANISSSHPHWQNTPLYFLAGHRGSDAHVAQANFGARWLLENGADPNVECGSCHETALIAAVRNGNVELANLLLEHGANPNVENDNGMRPYFLARALGLRETADLLERAGAEPDFDELASAIGEGEVYRVRQLIDDARGVVASGDQAVHAEGSPSPIPQSGSSLREGVGGGRSSEAVLLVKLAELGNTRGVEAALAAGIPIDCTGEAGATALHFACYRGWADTVDLLLSNSAPVEPRDCDYNATPLGWALEGMLYNPNPKGDYIRVVQALLSAGATDENLKERLATEQAEMPAMQELVGALTP